MMGNNTIASLSLPLSSRLQFQRAQQAVMFVKCFGVVGFWLLSRGRRLAPAVLQEAQTDRQIVM